MSGRALDTPSRNWEVTTRLEDPCDGANLCTACGNSFLVDNSRSLAACVTGRSVDSACAVRGRRLVALSPPLSCSYTDIARIALDEELIAGLKQAKTQPRHFGIVAKGNATVHAIIRKKPVKDGELLKAKSEFKGNATFQGVVQFDGEAYMFSFTEDPGLGLVKLRAYLTDHTGLAMKVACQVVATLPQVPDADDDASGKPSSPTESPPVSTPPADAPPPASDDLRAKLIASLKKLTASASGAIGLAPNRKDEILSGLAGVKAAIGAGKLDTATNLLLAVDKIIQSILSGAKAGAEPPPPKEEDEEVTLEEDALLDSLFPDPDDQDEPEDGGERVGGNESGENPVATTEPPIPPPRPVPPAAKSPGVGGRLRWEQVKEEVDADLSQLQAFLRQQADPVLQRIGEIGFHGVTGRLQVGLRVALIEFDRSATTDDREKFRQQSLKIIGDYKTFLKDNRLLKKCDDNPFGIKLNAETRLTAALNSLEQSLQA